MLDPRRVKWRAVSKAGRGARSLFSKAPKASATLERAGRLLRRKLGTRLSIGAERLSLSLHPACSAMVTTPEDGVLEVTCDLVSAGPGLAPLLLTMLEPLLDELDFVWQAGPQGDEASAPRELAALQRGFAAWVQERVRAAGPEVMLHLGVPRNPTFELEAAVLTPMGPRDQKWCEQVAERPEIAADGWPLWQLATEASLALARALWLLWLELPWRHPTTEDDHELAARAHRELRAAYQLDPSLPLPWPEWAELLRIHDELADELASLIEANGQHGTPTIGYRRHPAVASIAHGWSAQLPPHCVTALEGGDTLLASDGVFQLRCTCTESVGDDASTILAKVPMRSEPIERFAEDGQVGRIEVRDDDRYGVRVFTGIMATDGHAAVMTVLALPSEEDWVLTLWRNLRREQAAK